MKLNCRVGDDAFIVHTCTEFNFLLGHVCKVVAVAEPLEWFVELSARDHREIKKMYPHSKTTSILDKNLRPIRDPGDDAVDESHAWLPPVPTKEPA